MRSRKQSKIWPIIKKNRFLRSLSLLISLLILLMIFLIAAAFSYRQKIDLNEAEIRKNITLFQSLNSIALVEGQTAPVDDLFLKKSFASTEEVIPFIAFLESLFSSIDPNAEVIIKSRESQIFLDHFADYTVSFYIQDKDMLYGALDKLEESRFIINILNFYLNYKSSEDGETNHLDEAEFTIRLFLK